VLDGDQERRDFGTARFRLGGHLRGF